MNTIQQTKEAILKEFDTQFNCDSTAWSHDPEDIRIFLSQSLDRLEKAMDEERIRKAEIFHYRIMKRLKLTSQTEKEEK